ncbi:MAG: holo-ACP synthase [Actinomycetes bacterium]|jgi:holo-[acyl-carrier protein] synthase
MIEGIGIDVVDIARFQESLDRTPAMRERIFTEREALLKVSSLAARFAAKEALVKALDARDLFSWHDAEVINQESGKPAFIFTGALAARVAELKVHLTLSHDAGIASAMVVIERI